MARKVLISFLGTGGRGATNLEDRDYKSANYRIGDTNLGNYSFVSAALMKHYQADTLFLLGTVHSMWEKVYDWFSKEHGNVTNEDIWMDIFEHCEQANYLSPLELPHKNDIEQAIGRDSKVILIKYGITDEEIKENINIILSLQQYLKDEDELIVDITHSFRSLPMFIMNLLIYMQNVSNKKVNISHIHYGMLDINSELGFAPIVDLTSILDVNSWISGAYAFAEFGNGYNVASLVEKDNNSVATIVSEFSDLMNLNHLYGIQSFSQRLSSIKNAEYDTMLPQLTINPVVEDFIKRFPSNEKSHSVFQLKVARWQFEHRKYAQSLLTITEAIITYVCELNPRKLNWEILNHRKVAKEVLWGDTSYAIRVENEVCEVYQDLNKIRNNTAHTKLSNDSVKQMIQKLRDGLKKLEKTIK